MKWKYYNGRVDIISGRSSEGAQGSPPPFLSSRSGSVTDHTVTQLLHTFAAVQQSLEEVNHISIKKLEEKTPCFRYTSIEKLLCCKSCKINASLE